jgi:hypothetical protein
MDLASMGYAVHQRLSQGATSRPRSNWIKPNHFGLVVGGVPSER